MAAKTIFVTVGTTKFDKLVERITEPSVLEVISSKGYKKLTVQYGKGKAPVTTKRIKLESFALKDSLEADIKKADLVISHAGAGSCMEVLRAGKPLIIVVNEDLMDNHQSELAEALSSRSFAVSCSVTTIEDALKSLDVNQLKPYPPQDCREIVKFLNKKMNIPL